MSSATSQQGGTEQARTAVIVMGVSGSGKTTVADLLGERLGWPVAEADDFHSDANKAKMDALLDLYDAFLYGMENGLKEGLTARKGRRH